MLVTAYDGSDREKGARAAGARYVLRKPVDFPRLLALIEKDLVGP
jgi:CheY-like chemotaxis protein